MDRIMLDLRCPRCNRPVQGTEEVKHVDALGDVPSRCQHCSSRVRLSEPTDEGLGVEVHFIPAKLPAERLRRYYTPSDSPDFGDERELRSRERNA